jgi:chemotaxis signal transduction protein
VSQNESCPDGCLFVLCVFFLLDGRVEGKVYGFRIEVIKITEVAEKARITKVAEMTEMTEGV